MKNTEHHQNTLWACLDRCLVDSGPEAPSTTYVLSKMDDRPPTGATLEELLDYMWRHKGSKITRAIMSQALEVPMHRISTLLSEAMHEGYIKKVPFDGNCAAYMYAREGSPL